MKTLCIIPACTYSRVFPGMYFPFPAGKPLIVLNIEAARRAVSIDRVVVATNDHTVGAWARHYGAQVTAGPQVKPGEPAPVASVLNHVLDCLLDHEKYQPDLVVFLNAASPFVSNTDIDKAVKQLQRDGYDSIFSADAGTVKGLWLLDDSTGAIPFGPAPAQTSGLRHEPAVYRENGSMYVCKTDTLRNTYSLTGGHTGIFELPAECSLQRGIQTDSGCMEWCSDRRHFSSAPPGLPPRTPPVELLAHIRLLALDFDGVLTDNRVWVNGTGEEAVCCSRADSWGISCLKQQGVRVAVVSTETSPVVAARCHKLGIPCASGSQNKVAALRKISDKLGIDRCQIAFAGNDTNDAQVLRWVGLPILVNNALPELAPLAAWITCNQGGHGAVREICDLLISAQRATGLSDSANTRKPA